MSLSWTVVGEPEEEVNFVDDDDDDDEDEDDDDVPPKVWRRIAWANRVM